MGNESDNDDEVQPLSQPSSQARLKWSTAEDEALISAYMGLHCAVVGTNQKVRKLWKKVAASYEIARQKNPKDIGQRNVNMMKARWGRLSPEVLKWVGCYEEAVALNDEDALQSAHQIFERNNDGRHFSFYPAWIMLQKYQNWQLILESHVKNHARGRPCNRENSPESAGSGKRVRLSESGCYSTPPTPTTSDPHAQTSHSFGVATCSRPTGVKEAKEKAKEEEKGVAIEQPVEVVNNLGDKLQNFTDLQKQRLELDKAKEERKLRELQLQEKKMKQELLTMLWNKPSLTPEEEEAKNRMWAELISQ